MKAIVYTRYGSPDVLQFKEVDKPAPKEHEVLVKIHAASANTLDWRLMRAEPFLARLENGLFKPKQTKLGADLAGRVEAVGSGVTQFQPGDAVFGDIWLNGLGGFADYGCTREDTLVLKPTNISFEAAAAVPIAALTALQGLRDKGQIQPGQKVLINGASGGVGTFAVQIAKAFGAEVTGVCSTRNVDMVRSIGADYVIDYTREDFSNNGQQYDLIFCAVGNRSVSEYKRALKPQGVCVIAGFTSLRLMFEHSILGPRRSKAGGQRVGMTGTVKPNQADLTIMKELLEAGKVVPVIDRCYPLRETAEAIRYLEAGRARGKVVITVTHSRQIGGFMKAIVWTQYGSPDVLQLREVNKPAPKEDEVLIRIVATTVTSGDCEMRGLSGARWYTLLLRAYVGLRTPTRITILGMDDSGHWFRYHHLFAGVL